MSRASTVTKLPLATWFQYMGIHPLHAMQVRLADVDVHCNDVYFQHEWQTADHVSREEIARAIAEAESKLEDALGYRLAPTWEVDEWHLTQRPFKPEMFNRNGADIRGLKQIVQSDWGWLISGGIEAKELLGASVAIAYTDNDGDGYNETATVVVATTAVDKNEINIYYPGKSGDDSWEIRPTEVAIAAGNATITFRRELVVVEEKLETFDIEGQEAIGTVDADFLSTVDVYRRYNDPQTQASFLWEPLAIGCSACNGDGCSTCAYQTQAGCLILRSDQRNSVVGYSPGHWDNDLDIFVSDPWAVARLPEIIRLYYYSGYRNKRAKYVNRLDEGWARVITYMSAALLDRPPCDCGADVWRRYRQDLSMDSGDEDGIPIFRTPSGILDNPFGTRRGEVDAWRRISSFGAQRMTSVAL